MDRLLTEEELNKDIALYGMDYGIVLPDGFISDIVLLIKSQEQAKADMVNESGHWYAGTFGRDANGLELGHACQCGYKASKRASVDGHVEWKLSEQRAKLNQPNKEPQL